MTKKPISPPKTKYIFAIILAVFLVAAAIGVYYLATYESTNHAGSLSSEDLVTYNTVMTFRARSSGWVDQNAVVLLHSVQKRFEDDPQVVFYVYQLPKDKNPADYLTLRTDQLPQEDQLVHIGTISCRITDAGITSAYDLQASFTQ